MQTSRQGEAFISSFGYCPRPEKREGGGYVIGHGHIRSAWKGAPRVCRKEAQDLLRYDLMQIEPLIAQKVGRKLLPYQFDALSSLAHDAGMEALERTPLFSYLQEGRLHEAAECFSTIKSNPCRRAREKRLFLNASEQTCYRDWWGLTAATVGLFLMAVGAGGLSPWSSSVHTNALGFLSGAWLYLAWGGSSIATCLSGTYSGSGEYRPDYRNSRKVPD